MLLRGKLVSTLGLLVELVIILSLILFVSREASVANSISVVFFGSFYTLLFQLMLFRLILTLGLEIYSR